MNDQIFKNAPLDKDGVPVKSWKDYYQSRCLVLGTTQQQLDNGDWIFEQELTLSSECDVKWLVAQKVRLSELCVKTGLLTSKNEFRRKCEQKGLLYNGAPIDRDFEIDVDVPSIWHEVRLGKRFLEIVVPLKEWKDDPEES